MSHDVCREIRLKVFAEFGCAHTLESIRPLFEMLHAPDDLFRRIPIDACRRLLVRTGD